MSKPIANLFYSQVLRERGDRKEDKWNIIEREEEKAILPVDPQLRKIAQKEK